MPAAYSDWTSSNENSPIAVQYSSSFPSTTGATYRK